MIVGHRDDGIIAATPQLLQAGVECDARLGLSQ
jgi:hypothetical protein